MKVQPLGQTTNSLNEQVCKAASMSNEEIIKKSYAEGSVSSQNGLSGKLLKALPALAVGGVALANGIITKGKLSNKTKSVLYTVGAFALVSGIYDVVHSGIRKLKDKDENIKKADEKYPVAGALAKFGASFGASVLALKGLKQGAVKLAQKFPNVTQLYKKMSASVANVIDKSKLSKISDSIMDSLKNVANKYPKSSAFVKRNSFLLMIAGYIGLSTLLVAVNEKHKQKVMQSKATELSKEREQAQNIIAKAQELNTTSV